MAEDITWLAHYDDGATLAQADGNTYQDIDRTRLAIFDLWRADKLLVRVDLTDDAQDGVGPRRLIWRTRHFLNSAGGQVKVHLCGWQRRVAGRNIQAICYVTEDGVVLLGGQFGGNLPFGYAPVRLECEVDLA